MKQEYVMAIKCPKPIRENNKSMVMQGNSKSFSELIMQKEEEDGVLFIPREEAEKDENWLQVIPYFVLHTKDGKIVTYRRSKLSGEKRLVGQKAIGFGGHINTEDLPDNGAIQKGDYVMAYINGAKRELLEECGIAIDRNDVMKSIVGMVHERESDVGRVHIGIVHKILISEEQANSVLLTKAEEHYDLKIESPEEIKPTPECGIESWSEMALGAIMMFSDGFIEPIQEDRRMKRLHFAATALQGASDSIVDMMANNNDRSIKSISEKKTAGLINISMVALALLEHFGDIEESGFISKVGDFSELEMNYLRLIPIQEQDKINEFISKVLSR